MAKASPQVAAKTERLLNLVICLLYTRRALTKDQIRRAVPQYAEAASDEAFDRMFERDKDELREIGVPLVTHSVDVLFEDELGYRIDKREYALPAVEFTPDELTVLGLASQTWARASLAGPAALALRKLAVDGVERDDASLIGLEPRVQATEPSFDAVRRAVVAGTPIRFGYRKAGAATGTVRHVQPWGIASWHGRWYLTGHDTDRDDARVFRLSRIEGRVTVDGKAGSYAVPPGHEPRDLIRVQAREGTPVTAVVLVRPGVGHAVRRHASAVTSGGGWDRLEVTSPDVDVLAGELAGHGPQVLALSPPELVDAVTRRLTGARDAHARPRDARVDRTGAPAGPAADEAVGVAVAAAGRGARRSAREQGAESATDRLARLLTMVPWLLNRQGIDITAAAAEFGVTPGQIEADLSLLFLCGTPGGMPGDLIEAEWEGGRVYLGNADTIARPLRLGLDEAVTLIVGLRTLAAVPGIGDRAVIDRALAKLEEATGGLAGPRPGGGVRPGGTEAGDADRIRIDIADTPEGDLLPRLRAALAGRRRVHLTYWVPSRDETTERDVDPMRLTTMDGHWYLEGFCHRSGEVRFFRLDRIEELRVLEQDGRPPAYARSRDLDQGVFQPRPDDTVVSIALEPQARWVADYYPCDTVEETGSGGALIALRTADLGWLRRLLYRLGGAARALEPAELAADVRAGAEEALRAYADAPAGAHPDLGAIPGGGT